MKNYNAVLFDCDGVIINSNHIKTEAFYLAALSYGEDYASQLKLYHVQNGGISRYVKFKYFIENILKKEYSEKEYNDLLNKFSNNVVSLMADAKIDSAIFNLKRKVLNGDWMVVSGGDDSELQEIFHKKGILKMFELGIFGSPRTKNEIIQKGIYDNKIYGDVLYIGDSKYDFFVAKAFNFDFIFVSQWTEVTDWKKFVKCNNITTVASLSEIC
jgi:phosphoglycolate phosphatase-like HAD superfamily hydrolase